MPKWNAEVSAHLHQFQRQSPSLSTRTRRSAVAQSSCRHLITTCRPACCYSRPIHSIASGWDALPPAYRSLCTETSPRWPHRPNGAMSIRSGRGSTLGDRSWCSENTSSTGHLLRPKYHLTRLYGVRPPTVRVPAKLDRDRCRFASQTNRQTLIILLQPSVMPMEAILPHPAKPRRSTCASTFRFSASFRPIC